MGLEKCNIYAKFCNEHNPCESLTQFFNEISIEKVLERVHILANCWILGQKQLVRYAVLLCVYSKFSFGSNYF